MQRNGPQYPQNSMKGVRYNPAMKTLPLYEHATPQFTIVKSPSDESYLTMTYEGSLHYKIFNCLNSFTFHLRRDIPLREAYALQEMPSRSVSVQGE